MKKKIVSILNMDYIISILSLIVLVGVTFLGVIMRYFFNNPILWQEEVQLLCFLWIIFFGAGAAFRTGSHVAIDILVELVPINIRMIIEIFNYILTISILIFFYSHSSSLIQQMVTSERITSILHIKYSIIYIAFPISCIIMIINNTYAFFNNIAIKEIKSKQEDK